MVFLALACTALLGFGMDCPTPPPSSDFKDYEAAKAKAGRDPRSLVDLALWCEARGLDVERAKNLAAAVAADPANATARGLMGLVEHGGDWLSPDRVSDRVKQDNDLSQKLAEYNKRRDELSERILPKGRQRRWSRADAARAHVQLGMWCEKVGLKAEATAHFTSAVVLDPHDNATWKHLGCVRHNGRWMSPEQIASDRENAEAQHRADIAWEPQLKKWRSGLDDKSDVRRDEARKLLSNVTDKLSVPSIRRVFCGPKESDQKMAVQLLGQIDSPASSRALAELAVLSASDAVRSAAIATLRNREPRDFAGMLVEMIQTPMTYEAQPVGGPGSPGGLIVDTPRFQMLRTYDAPVVAKLGGNRTGYIGYDGNGLPIAATHAEMDRIGRDRPAQAAQDLGRLEAKTADMVATANLKAEVSQRRLLADIEAIEISNAEANTRNQWVISVLAGALDAPADLKDDEDAWHTWWYDKIGYRYVAPPKLRLAMNASPQYPPPVIVSCFVKGTPVRTLDGHRAIETLSVGDRVLTQDVATGSLSFQPVMVVHHNPPGATIRVKLDNGETVVASLFHRFWRVGKGWAMARDLKAGDILRTLGGRSRIVSLSDGPEEPLYNLDVSKTRTYFVGEHDALVHDNTLPEPRIKPFDAEPDLALERGKK